MSLFRLSGLSLNLAARCCFSDFSVQVEWGQKIALVGVNGCGKSSLLKFLAQQDSLCEGEIIAEFEFSRAYLPQHTQTTGLSGGAALLQSFNQLIRQRPDLLLLDEPSNHLDFENKQLMLKQIQHYPGNVIIVSHELDWLELCCDTFWIIEQQSIQVFHGRYRDWLKQRELSRTQLQQQRHQLKQQQQIQQQRLMHEQQRAAHARQRGIQAIQERRWATIRSATKLARGNSTAVDQRARLMTARAEITQQLQQLSPFEQIEAEFFLPPTWHKSDKPVVQLSAVEFGYGKAISRPCNLQLFAGQSCWLKGRNGSGKTSLLQAIYNLSDKANLRLAGDWYTPMPNEIAYLDQHYGALQTQLTALEYLAQSAPDWNHAQLRQHLAHFLLRGAICERACAHLSGGEKVRLSLAALAARTPRLLILDEPVNHLDFQSRADLLAVLQAYPGCYILVSHDEGFVKQLHFDHVLDLSV